MKSALNAFQVRNSLSGKLLRHVLSSYLLATVLLFIVEMSVDYLAERDNIRIELNTLHQAFGNGVALALWNFNEEQIEVELRALLNMPSVRRAVVRSEQGKLVRELISPHTLTELAFDDSQSFVVRREIRYSDLLLGTLEIQSNSGVIFERLKTSLLTSALSALLKAALLIVLIKLFFDRVLSRPLYRVANHAARLNPRQLRQDALPVDSQVPNELDVISSAINRLADDVANTVAELETFNRDLENQVRGRTADLEVALADLGTERLELAESLAQLRVAQEHLVQSEKMAALGALVAGVAHEINTPVGLSLTGATHFQHMVNQLDENYRAGELDENAFCQFVLDSKELARSITVSLERAAALIGSFKAVAVDQTQDSVRLFAVADYFGDVMRSFQPKLRALGVHMDIECDAALTIRSYPGAWGQIITNLINNSLLHAFDVESVNPLIRIRVTMDGTQVRVVYSDNGRGMNAEVVRRVFDPFFSTYRKDRGHVGGSGLGMHITYNLVTQRLRGSIHVDSAPHAGVRFEIVVPVEPE